MRAAIVLALVLVGCSGRRTRSFEQATADQAQCLQSEIPWVEQKEPGYWVAMCGDENGHPLREVRH